MRGSRVRIKIQALPAEVDVGHTRARLIQPIMKRNQADTCRKSGTYMARTVAAILQRLRRVSTQCEAREEERDPHNIWMKPRVPVLCAGPRDGTYLRGSGLMVSSYASDCSKEE